MSATVKQPGEQYKEWTLDGIADAISHIPTDDRELWIKIGMGLKAEFGDAVYDIWLDWSSAYVGFKEKDAQSVWRSIKSSGGQCH